MRLILEDEIDDDWSMIATEPGSDMGRLDRPVSIDYDMVDPNSMQASVFGIAPTQPADRQGILKTLPIVAIECALRWYIEIASDDGWHGFFLNDL